MDVVQYQKLLDTHDWLYTYADDLLTWRKGQRERDALVAWVKIDPMYKDMFDKKFKEVFN